MLSEEIDSKIEKDMENTIIEEPKKDLKAKMHHDFKKEDLKPVKEHNLPKENIKHSDDKTKGKNHGNPKADSKPKDTGERIKGNILFTLILIAILALGAFAVWYNYSGDSVTTEKGVAAVVNGVKIPLSKVDEQYDALPEQYKAIVSKKDILDQLIQEELLYQEAIKQGFQVSEADVEKEIENVLSDKGIPKDKFISDLKEKGMDYQTVVESFMRNMAIAKLINSTVLSNIEVSDQEIEEYYNTHSDSPPISIPEQIRARHILVSNESDAKEIKSMLDKGYDFAELAKERSEGPSASRGGDLGWFSKGMMVPEFEEAAFALKVGDVSDIVKTKYGYHIIQVTGRKYAETRSIKEAEPDIRDILVQSKQKSAISTYIEQIRSKADIKILMDQE